MQFCVCFIALWSKLAFVPILTYSMIVNLGSWLKDWYLKYKQQRLDFCEVFTVWYFATNWAPVKLVMSRHFSSEWKDLSYNGSTTWPEYIRKKSIRQGAGCTHGKRPRSRQGQGGVTTTPILPAPFLVWSQHNYQRLLKPAVIAWLESMTRVTIFGDSDLTRVTLRKIVTRLDSSRKLEWDSFLQNLLSF